MPERIPQQGSDRISHPCGRPLSERMMESCSPHEFIYDTTAMEWAKEVAAREQREQSGREQERARIRREQAVHIAALRNSEDEFVRYAADRLEEATRDA